MSDYFNNPLERAINRWEWPNVHDRDRSRVSGPTARAIVSHIWQMCRLPGNPPSVRLTTPDGSVLKGAVAYTDTELAGGIVLQQDVATTVIIHEMAHVLTDDPLDRLELRPLQEREQHGRLWLANYVWLLDRLMGPGFNTFYLRSTMPPLMRGADLPYCPTIWGKPRPGL